MAIRLPSHLHRARSGMLHFRIAIPPDLNEHFKTREIYRSLRTASIREATGAAQTLAQALKQIFTQLRSQTMSTNNTPPRGPSEGFRTDLKVELDFDELRRPKRLHIQSEPGDAPDAVSKALAAIFGTGTAGAGTPAPEKPLILFSQLVEDYKRDRLSGENWEVKTEDENMAAYRLCMDIIGDLPIHDIDEDRALTYFETLKRLPPNMNKMPAYKGKSIEEIIALNPTPISTRTINKNVERVSSLFKWAKKKPRYALQYNPFEGRSLPDNKAKKREPFTTDELVRLFDVQEHAQREYKTDYSYWLPIMGLLTGARLNELCQLHLSDFEDFEGIHCINIQDEEEGQKLKNDSARRHVPIHEKLIEVGLVRYVEYLRAQGEVRLFPTLKLTKNGYGDAPSKWFGRLKTRCGMAKHTKVFHSFRHTFISSLLNDDVPESAIAPIVGHEGKLITSRVYWNVKAPAKRKPTVDKFQLPAEVWRLIPKFEEVTITGGDD